MKSFSTYFATGILGLVLLFCPAARAAPSTESPFTVADSVNLALFSNVGQAEGGSNLSPELIFSPDRKYAAFVTTRGLLPSDKLESTVWLYSTGEVQAYLHSSGEAPPKPRALARVAVTPRRDTFWSYAPIIGKLRWLRNSRGILFLAEDGSGEFRLYRASLGSQNPKALSPAGYDVNNFAVAAQSVVFAAAPMLRGKPVGIPINADASDATGAKWPDDVLFPDPIKPGPVSLWKIDDFGQPKLIRGSGALGISADNNTVFTLSANGKELLTTIPVKSIPEEWANFVPVYPQMSIKPQKTTGLQEYGSVDLGTLTAKPLIRGPLTPWLGLGDVSAAFVSPSGLRTLLLGVFIAPQKYPCIAALVDNSNSMTCVAWSSGDYVHGSPNQDRNMYVMDAAFGATDNDVTLKRWNWDSNRTVIESYRYEDGAWKLLKTTASNIGSLVESADSVSFSVREDLNVPPTLWATDLSTNVSKVVFDPNPQLSRLRLGVASEIHWNDETGEKFSGGLVLPPDYVKGKRYPLIIQTHGFEPGDFMVVTDGAYPSAFAARPLASAGFVVLQINGSAKEGMQELLGTIRGMRSAVARLNAMGLVDPHRVGAIGFSRTCWYVEGALIADPQLLAAASITDGIDQSYWQYISSGGRSDGPNLYGAVPFGKGLNAWVKYAPGFHLDQVRAPLLITGEGSGSLLWEWEIYASLRMQKKPVDLLFLKQPDGNRHILRKPLERMASQQTNVDWFRFWLQGYEDPNPAKRELYKQWEALRNGS